MKGLDKITNILNNFLVEFELEAQPGEDFCAYLSENIISYALVVSEFADKVFSEFVYGLCEDLSADVFLLSFFHELGHFETYENLSRADEDYSYNSKIMISSELAEEDISLERKRRLYFDYFLLPDELAATLWAIDYMQKNRDKVAIFWDELNKAIQDFYILNNVA